MRDLCISETKICLFTEQEAKSQRETRLPFDSKVVTIFFVKDNFNLQQKVWKLLKDDENAFHFLRTKVFRKMKNFFHSSRLEFTAEGRLRRSLAPDDVEEEKKK